jgi:hypothetical protein
MLRDDTDLRRWLHPGDGRFSIWLSQAGLWLELGAPGTALVHRLPPQAPVVDLLRACRDHAELVARLGDPARRQRAWGQAEQLLEPLFARPSPPTRRQVQALQGWEPLIERHAYWVAARLTQVIDAERPPLLAALGAERAEAGARACRYWRLVLMMAHMTLLAAAPGASGWLTEMARSFTWERWTPSFPLVRERSLYVAGIAGRAAAAFGAGVTESYLRMLAGVRSPLGAFDAVLGLSAIALADPSACGSIHRELQLRLERMRAAGTAGTHVEGVFRSAFAVLRDPPAARQRAAAVLGLGEPTDLLATPAVLRADAASCLASGEYLGLIALPAMIAAPMSAFFPQRVVGAARLWLSEPQILGVLRGSWCIDDPTARPTVH